jgi:hypothetical protein
VDAKAKALAYLEAKHCRDAKEISVLKPVSLACVDAKAEALAYLEAKSSRFIVLALEES